MTQLDRLNKVRETIEEKSKSKERLTGELETYQKRMEDIEEDCKKEFSVSIDELPGVVKKIEDDAEKAIVEAEKILGL